MKLTKLTIALALMAGVTSAQNIEPLKYDIGRQPLAGTGMSNYRYNVVLGNSFASSTVTLPTFISVTSAGIKGTGYMKIKAVSGSSYVPVAVCPIVSDTTNICGAGVASSTKTDGTGWIWGLDQEKDPIPLTGVSASALTKLGLGSSVTGSIVTIQFFGK